MKTPFESSRVLDRGGNPTVRELLSSLVFNPVDGSIRLNGDRIVMQRTAVNLELRRELIRVLGEEEARIFLMRLGFHSGQADARFVRASWPNLDSGDAFTAGTRLHTFSGVVRVETVYNDFDFRKKRFSAEFLWHESAEAAEFRRTRPAVEPVCWTQLGYACGYASEFFDTLIIYKEVECAGQGHQHCRVVGKPADMWGASDPHVQLFRERIVGTDHQNHAGSARPLTIGAAERILSDLDRLLLAPVLEQLGRFASVALPVLVSGATGTGRTLAARHIHRASGGKETELRHVYGPQVDLALCADIVRNAKNGRRTAAGTLVIDGAEHVPADVQPHVARAIDEGISAGGPRVVALIESDGLRAPAGLSRALWQVLCPLVVHMPAFRDRTGDVVDIAQATLASLCARMGREQLELGPTAATAIQSASWPGNLLQMRSVLAAVLVDQSSDAPLSALQIEKKMRSLAGVSHVAGEEPQGSIGDLVERLLDEGPFQLSDLERQAYSAAVERAGGNLSAAARLLGLTRPQLAYRLKSMHGAA
jgi:transcriptional regulator with AAA-type ATPase domain